MRATTIQLFQGFIGNTDGYVGCWHVPCPDDDPRRDDLDAVGCGRYLDEDGHPRRSFFFADEIAQQLAEAERTTGCVAELDESWPYPHHDVLSAADESRVELNEHLERRSSR